MDNPYEVLGLSKMATPEEIKRTFRRLSMDCHPDMFPDDPDAAKKFQRLKEAYDTLSDPAKKKVFDKRPSVDLNRGVSSAVLESFLQFFRAKKG